MQGVAWIEQLEAWGLVWYIVINGATVCCINNALLLAYSIETSLEARTVNKVG